MIRVTSLPKGITAGETAGEGVPMTEEGETENLLAEIAEVEEDKNDFLVFKYGICRPTVL